MFSMTYSERGQLLDELRNDLFLLLNAGNLCLMKWLFDLPAMHDARFVRRGGAAHGRKIYSSACESCCRDVSFAQSKMASLRLNLR